MFIGLFGPSIFSGGPSVAQIDLNRADFSPTALPPIGRSKPQKRYSATAYAASGRRFKLASSAFICEPTLARWHGSTSAGVFPLFPE